MWVFASSVRMPPPSMLTWHAEHFRPSRIAMYGSAQDRSHEAETISSTTPNTQAPACGAGALTRRVDLIGAPLRARREPARAEGRSAARAHSSLNRSRDLHPAGGASQNVSARRCAMRSTPPDPDSTRALAEPGDALLLRRHLGERGTHAQHLLGAGRPLR